MIFYFNYFCFVSFDVSFKKKELCYHRQEEITPSYKILIGRADAEAEAPILWPPDAKSRLIGEDPDAVKTQEKSFIRSDLANIPLI